MDNLEPLTLSDPIQEDKEYVLYRGRRSAGGPKLLVKGTRAERPSPRQIDKLRHEHAILRELADASVLRPLGLSNHGHRYWLYLEDFGGRPLHDALGAGRLDIAAALRIGAAAAGAVDSVHLRRVIHKDITPRAIFLHPETGEVRLAGFGIATLLSQETPRAKSPASLEGTLSYMAPEQTGRMNRVIDHRTDLYALGVTLYELLTGRLPFETADPLELVHSHIARSPRPPQRLRPEVPGVVSDIVMKLLAKAAEDRYQSAAGLRADLEECLARLSATGQIAPMPLGRRDRGGELRIPQKLYGREAELATLMAAWGRASQGEALLLLVAGLAGVGKSALVNEIHKAIAGRRGGYFIAGKFDQLNQSVPYAPVMRAFRELCRHLLTERADALDLWKSRIAAALGQSGQVLVDVIPELGWILGPQPSVPALGPTEAQNRFGMVFQGFLRVLATPEHPLVVFLDDLQWADAASLKLLELLLTNPDSAHLLVICAYREEEVGAGHPMSLALRELRKAGTVPETITLRPLGLSDARTLIADALGCAPARAAPLAELVLAKTHGNPFFMGQFLEGLAKEGRLSFDAQAGAWGWDIEALKAAGFTDNVIEFMARKLQQLAPATQRVLELAACIGHRFDLRTLAIISEKRPVAAAHALWAALQQGVIVPLDADYRFIHVHEDEGANDGTPTPPFEVSYRFLHDRVQQAAYALIDPALRQEIHLRIGRLLRQKLRDSEPDEGLFAVVHHLNLGAERIADPPERGALARLNLTAGRRAKAGTAYEAAARYGEAGISLLTAASWASEHELAFSLHLECAECAYLSGSFARAESLLGGLLSRARSDAERARVHDARIALLLTLDRIADALAVGREALALFGIDLPTEEGPRKAAMEAAFTEVEADLAGRPIGDLLHAPVLVDPDKRAVMRLLMALTMPASFTSAALLSLICIKQVSISLRFGHTDISAYGYMAYAWIVARVRARYREAFELGRLALSLNEKFGNAELDCKLNLMFGSYLDFFCEHLRSALGYLKRGYHAGMNGGDFSYLSYTCVHTFIFKLGLGDEIGALREEVEKSLSLMQRTKDEQATLVLLGGRQVLANLEGRTRARRSLSDEGFDEALYAAKMEAPGHTTIALAYYSFKAQLLFLYEDHEGALSAVNLGEGKLGVGVGHFFATELFFYASLALAALYPAATPAEKERYAALLASHTRRIAAFAASCPENFRHKHLLVLAESARISGDDSAASDLYDQAIESAHDNEFVRDEALASELCAKFYAAKGKAKIARVYMNEARSGYFRWGATAKVKDLEERYAHLTGAAGAPRSASDAPVAGLRLSSLPASFGERAQSLDAATVVRASQAISSEIVLDRVVDRLMRIVIENAGAQKGVLVLSREGRLTVAATITVDPDEVKVGLSTPLDESADAPASIVQYVARSQEPVVLGDATAEHIFAADPYIAEQRPRSVLVLAMMRQGHLTGVLYLENNALKDAFNPARLELCGLLSSQAAIAVENALLYANVEAVTAELRRSNGALEEEVARRTDELQRALSQLSGELAERKRADAERVGLQEAIIRVQAARLMELSTPLIPLTDQIMVMPLIGTMDEERAAQVLETALRGAAARRARVVIVDITGVKQVDAEVASALVRMAGALRLLGSSVVLTGISPEAAQALVMLGADLGALVTRGTLQSGIAYALGRVGGRAP